MNYNLYVILLVIGLCDCQSDDAKWIWESSGKRKSDSGRTATTGDRRYNAELVSKPLFKANSNYGGNRQSENLQYRYEVTEESDYDNYRPRPTQQYRPDTVQNRPYRPDPDFVRPTNILVENSRPTYRPYESSYRPNGNEYRPSGGDYSLHGLKPGIGTNGKPILTGPTPSWVEDDNRKYKDYDVCKCVHSFNCNSPGIKFGSCDADKQYCCYKSQENDRFGNGGKPVTHAYERLRPRPVLAGPGGPVDYPRRPYQNKVIPGRPPIRPVPDPDEDLEEAYRKGLASSIYRYETRPHLHSDRDFHRYPHPHHQDRYSPSRPDNYRGSNISKYGLYYPQVDIYARSSGNFSIADSNK